MARGVIRVLEDLEAVSRAAAAEVVARAAESIAARGRFLLALAGGHTPRRLYEILGADFRDAVEWERVHVFWGDERCVPPEHPASNYRLARAPLLDRVAVPAVAVHRIRGELEPAAAAAAYDEELARFFGRASPPAPAGPGEGRPEGRAAFDVVLLGLGDDGHTASLFPGQVEPGDERWARPAVAPPGVEPRDRITLTLRALDASRRAIFLVAGAAKATALERVRRALDLPGARGPLDREAPPASMVQPVVESIWLADRAAAG